MTKKNGITADAVAAARHHVEELNAAELNFALLSRSKAAEAATERAQRGDRILAATDPGGAAQVSGRRVAELAEEQAAMVDASKRARERRIAAIPSVYKAEADLLESEALSLEAQASELKTKSDELRKALEEFDGCSYAPVRPVPTMGNGGLTVVMVRQPRYMTLRQQAEAKRAAAAQLRVKEPHDAGMVEADTVDDLLSGVYSDPLRIGPPADAMITWAEQAADKERRRRARFQTTAANYVPVDSPMTWQLEWRNGTLDAARSSVLLSEPEPQGETEAETYRRADRERFEAANDRRRAEAESYRPINDGRSPFDTSATPDEIAREAAATGKSIAQVAAEFAASAQPRQA
jgi:hypothetical protein